LKKLRPRKNWRFEGARTSAGSFYRTGSISDYRYPAR